MKLALLFKKLLSASFLDDSHVFDNVWYTGLLYKSNLSQNIFLPLKSYVTDTFFINISHLNSSLKIINSDDPQGAS